MTLEDVTIFFILWLLFLSLIFWQIKWIFLHFLHILAILKDFLTEKKKVNKMKKVRLVDTYLECGLRFFHFQ